MGAPDPRSAVRCHRCATLVAGGASYCSTCGDALSRAEAHDVEHGCPRCGEEVTPAPRMAVWGICASHARPDGHPVHGCQRCGGAWVDKETLAEVIRTMAERAPPPEGRPPVHRRSLSRGTLSAKIVYRRCAVCSQRMHRRNFARVSGVIVDECGTHGTFFDSGELEDVLAFVQTGGLAVAEERRRAEAERDRRRSEIGPGPTPAVGSSLYMPDDEHVGIAFVRWAVRWLRRAV